LVEVIKFFFELKFILERKVSYLVLQVSVLLFFSLNTYSSISDWNKGISTIFNENTILLQNKLLTYIFVNILLSLFWFILRKKPKFKKNQIGILFSILTENDNIKRKIKTDFFDEIKKQIQQIDKNIKIKILSEYQSRKLQENPSSVTKFQHKCNSKFLLHGHARIRRNNNKDYYSIELNESIIHDLIDKRLSDVILKDMRTVFPQNTLINNDEEYSEFKLSSEIFSYGSIYILGVACFFSRDYHRAFKFFSVLISKEIDISKIKDKDGYARILKNTKEFKVSILHHLAYTAYSTDDDIKLIEHYINLSKADGIVNYDLLLLEGILYFKKGNLLKAIEITNEAKKISKRDFTWALNMGFLLAYDGKPEETYLYYKKAFDDKSINVHIQCEVFIEKILKKEPEKYQLHYCLGLIYFFIHKDYKLALEEFEMFVDKENIENSHTEIKRHANKYINKCNK